LRNVAKKDKFKRGSKVMTTRKLLTMPKVKRIKVKNSQYRKLKDLHIENSLNFGNSFDSTLPKTFNSGVQKFHTMDEVV
jgi:hypothetical protein